MEELHQHIEDYLNNRLDAVEKAIFERRMAQDEDFREEVVKLQLLRMIAKRQATRDKIQLIQAQKLANWRSEEAEEVTENENEEVQIKPRFRVLRNFGTLAAAASIAAVCYLNFSPITLPNDSTLAERGNSAELDSSQKANFENYLAAQKALKFGNNELAIERFEQVMAGKDLQPYYIDASKWFIAVANVDKNPEKAEDMMQDILSKKDFKYEISFLDKARMWMKIQVNKIKNGFK